MRSRKSKPRFDVLLRLSASLFCFAFLCSTAAAQQTAADSTRPKAIEHSDAYYTRLTIHRVGSYAELPLFGAEYFLGDRLMNAVDVPTWVKPAHVAVASGLGVLFAVNTVTGVWNLYEARKDPDSARRYIHVALMLAADAGFLYTATLAGDAGHSDSGANKHRNAALVSFSLASVGTAVMWLWKPKD